MEDVSGLLKEYFLPEEEKEQPSDVYESIFKSYYNTYLNEESFITNQFNEGLYENKRDNKNIFYADEAQTIENVIAQGFSNELKEYFSENNEKISDQALRFLPGVLAAEGLVNVADFYKYSYDNKTESPTSITYLNSDDKAAYNSYSSSESIFSGGSAYGGDFLNGIWNESHTVNNGLAASYSNAAGDTFSGERMENVLNSYLTSEGGDHRSLTNNISPTVNLYSQGGGNIDVEEIADKIADMLAEAASGEANGFYK